MGANDTLEQLVAAQDHVATLEAKIAELEAANATLARNNTSLRAGANTSAVKIRALEAKVDSLSTENGRLEGDNRTLERKIEQSAVAGTYFRLLSDRNELSLSLAAATARVAELEATFRQEWLEGIPNDGVYEYTETHDCDGTFIKRLRRTPTLVAVIDAGEWTETNRPMPALATEEGDVG